MNYVHYMEIYDKTHVKFADSKEENKTQKKNRKKSKLTSYQSFCFFIYSSYLKELS